MPTLATLAGFSFSSLPLTVSEMPGGLPITIDTGLFSVQVMVWPAWTVTWDTCLPVGSSKPTQQAELAVSLITASSFGTTAWRVAGVGVTVAFGVVVTDGRTVAAAFADWCPS